MAVNNTVSFQVVLIGSAQQLPANFLVQGGTFAAKVDNSGDVAIGNSAAVTTTNSFLLNKGLQIPFAGNNTDQVWINGTTSDVLSFIGN